MFGHAVEQWHRRPQFGQIIIATQERSHGSDSMIRQSWLQITIMEKIYELSVPRPWFGGKLNYHLNSWGESRILDCDLCSSLHIWSNMYQESHEGQSRNVYETWICSIAYSRRWVLILVNGYLGPSRSTPRWQHQSMIRYSWWPLLQLMADQENYSWKDYLWWPTCCTEGTSLNSSNEYVPFISRGWCKRNLQNCHDFD